METQTVAAVPPSDGSVDAFIDALWLEEGLSRNTLEAYRRDLNQLLAHRQRASLLACASFSISSSLTRAHSRSA